MSTPMAETRDDDGGGARPRLSRGRWALVVVGLVVLTGITAWFAWGVSSQPARWQDVGFEVISPTEAEVTFDVFLYADEPVTCYVHAMNVQYAEVGVAEVAVDPADGDEQRFTLAVPTVEEANTALVRGCAPQ
ncbi:DUF4307 domain-containing protein [Demequina muriae]|uniref:DUF4307 domain-containing protein n=1 Tax=Demequina muriae TaxID=3051664 RepID=A0ABT8GF34_9MICO|nr:DUF4307 domain-containing protein [Demequina sp. EGI L300058]MDN4480047.1 DUF4307 domain-containing protein [Demequina sp. EGI L300058]